MKTIINITKEPTLHGAAIVLLAVSLLAGAARADGGAVQRLAAIVDYVAADYPGAVRDGQVLSATEYEEQANMVRDARALADKVVALDGAKRDASHAALVADLDRLVAAVAGKAEPRVVADAARTIRQQLIDDFGLVLVPPGPPSRERAQKTYATLCASCHGADGRADTAQARTLSPPPLSFFDHERMDRVSPSLAYHALNFGVVGTAMPAFDSLPPMDRWSLAFYVTALRHEGADLAAGQRALASAHAALAATPARLATLTDEELDAQLAPSLPRAEDRAAAIDWLRAAAPFQADGDRDFAIARGKLAELLTAARSGDYGRARELALSAYLDGIEPHEAAMRARDPAHTVRVENAFLDLRRAIDQHAAPDALAKQVALISLLLDSADQQPMSRNMAFAASLTIALREGLEAALLIAALLAFLRKTGRADRAVMVHAGWLAAVPATVATWFVAGSLIGGAHRELMEGTLTLLAAALILGVSHWVFGKHEAMHWLGFLRRKVTDLAPGEHAWPLLLLAFLAAYREGFEVVLFYRALMLDAATEQAAVALGAAIGAVGIVGVVVVLGRLGRRFNPRPVMLVSSVLLAALAIAMVGHGVRALQEGGYVPVTPLALPDLSAVGLYPSAQGLGAQLLVLLIVLAPSILAKLRPSATPTK